MSLYHMNGGTEFGGVVLRFLTMIRAYLKVLGTYFRTTDKGGMHQQPRKPNQGRNLRASTFT